MQARTRAVRREGARFAAVVAVQIFRVPVAASGAWLHAADLIAHAGV